MNVKNVIVILCVVVGCALAIHIPDDDYAGNALERRARQSLKEKKEKRSKEKRNSQICRPPSFGKLPEAADECFKPVEPGCLKEEEYRRQDGACNNYEFPTWAKSSTQFIRVIPNRWNDSISIPRKSNKLGTDPQNVRTCRIHLLKIRNDYHKKLSVNVMSFGQLGAHDTFLSALSEATCCPMDTTKEDQCWSIDLPPGDEIYEANNGCIPVNRVMTTRTICKVEGGPQQINKNTPVFDLDIILGRDEETKDSLIDKKTGKLLVQLLPNQYGHIGSYFPNSDNVTTDCSGNQNREEICFKTSDERVNQNPWLTVLHVLFLREFNRIVDAFHEMNPRWDAKKLFQEARKVVGAEMQKIIAYDWLPYVIGEKKMKECELNKPASGEYTYWDRKLHPNSMAEAGIVAMRILHTIIPDEIWLYSSSNTKSFDRRNLKDYFNRAGKFIPDNFDALIRSLSFQPTKDNDKKIPDATGNNMFKRPNQRNGQDLSSIDMQRGIETGIGTYNDLRHYCGQETIKSFDEFAKYGDEVTRTLRECYDSVDDIDGIIGVTRLEEPLEGGLVGETGACIIAEQFKRWRFGDSWWFDGSENKNKFTKEQMIELQDKINLARIFCDNGNELEEIQPNIWVVPGGENQVVDCKKIPSIDLTLWKDEEDSSSSVSKSSGSTLVSSSSSRG